MSSHGEKVAIPTRGIAEPNFHHSRRTGRNRTCRPRQQGVCQGRRDPAAERRRRARRPQGQPGRVGRGRVRVHAVEGGVPRHVLRGSRTPRPRQEKPEGDNRGRSAARRLHRHRQSRQPQRPAHDAQQHGAPHFAETAQSLGPRGAARGDRERTRPRRRGRGRKAAARTRPPRAPQQDHPLHRPDRRPLQPVSSACRARTPRR